LADEDETGGGGDGGGAKTVPYDRFQKVVQERNEWKSKASTFERDAQANAERAATSDTLAKQLEDLKGEFKSARSAWDLERGMMGAGLTDQEGRDVAQMHYGRLAEKDRPTMTDWLEGLRKDPTKAPRSLQPFLGDGKADTATAGAGKSEEPAKGSGGGGKATGLPRSTGREPASSTGANTGDPMSAGQLRQIREKAQQSGDWTEWRRATGQTKSDDGGKAA
jgi:hypothetical protein